MVVVVVVSLSAPVASSVRREQVEEPAAKVSVVMVSDRLLPDCLLLLLGLLLMVTMTTV